MDKIEYVMTGEVKVASASEGVRLVSSALGSCIAICVYDAEQKIGAMAHILMPGYAPLKENENKAKYAGNAIGKLIEIMGLKCCDRKDIVMCLVGGANVLNRAADDIAKKNIESVVNILKDRGCKVKTEAIGGTIRRTAIVDVSKGSISFTEGSGEARSLMSLKVALGSDPITKRPHY